MRAWWWVRWWRRWWWCVIAVGALAEACAPPEDLVRCAAAAPLVLSARLRSASADKRASTFQVKRVFQGQAAANLAANDTVRVKSAWGGAWGSPDPLHPDKVYLLLAEQPSRGQPSLRLLAPPLLSRCLPLRFRHELRLKHRNPRDHAHKCRANEEYKRCDTRCCDNKPRCAKYCVSGCFCKTGFTLEQGNCVRISKGSIGARGGPTVVEIKQGEQRVIADKLLRLDCKVQGRPPQGLVWLKDGQLLNPKLGYSGSSRVDVSIKRRHSWLEISRVRPEDSGTYECRTISVRPQSARVNVTVNNESVILEAPCPMELPNSYCLNGGTCFYIPGVAEISCRCKDDYQGEHCEYKVVSNRSSMYHSYCKLGLSSSYYC